MPTPLHLVCPEGVSADKWLARFHANHPGREVRCSYLAWSEQPPALGEGAAAVDLLIARDVVRSPHHHHLALFAEPWVVLVSPEHPASVLDDVTLADLVDERSWETGDELNLGQIVQTVAAGTGYVKLPASVARARSRRDVVAVPLLGVPECEVALTWIREPEHPWAQDFVGAVRGRRPSSSRGAK